MKTKIRKTRKLLSYLLVMAMVLTAVTPFFGENVMAAAGLTITESAGWLETAYVEWEPVNGAVGYTAYVKGASDSDAAYVQLDSELIRQYSSYWRADAVGLAPGNYVMKIVAVMSDGSTATAVTNELMVSAHDRTGFAWVNGSASGAYNENGTLKSNAVVLYITEKTKDSVSMDVVTSSSGAKTSATGLQNILNAYKKGYDSRPLAIRLIGNISDLATMESGDILIKGSSSSKRLSSGITFEGIGEDATANGWGLRIANASNVEVRNIGFMNCDSGEGDNVGLQQNNDHVWVHNCDFFYGDAGSDADQAKGDGALDTKTSTYVTHSYNHFFDTGKSNLQGMKSESTDNYITYHHNWYDHSDSRHPRIRTCTVHIYNNYFDGTAKYGVGVTMGASAFVENNYFRNCPYPMLSSEQGSDVSNGNEGTFSGETGGIIKSYNNTIVNEKAYVTYQENSSAFDAYEVTSAGETVPSSVKTISGGTTYNNFDTSSMMYGYNAQTPENAAFTVQVLAGRMNGGDFKWEFDDSVDDASYSLNTALKSALKSYSTSLVAVGGYEGVVVPGEEETTKASETEAPTVTEEETTKPVETETETEKETEAPVVAGKSYVHNFTEDGKTSTFFSITGNLSTSKGTVSYDGLTLKQCLKMESSTNVSFTTDADAKLVLVFNSANSANVKVDGVKYELNDGILNMDVTAGTHTITKADTANLFYVAVVSGSTGETETEAPTVTEEETTKPVETEKETKTEAPVTQAPTTEAPTTQAPTTEDVLTGDVKVKAAGGWNETLYIELSGVSDSNVKSVSYSGAMSGELSGNDFTYLVRDIDGGVRVDIPGLKAGTYSVTVNTSKGNVTKSGIAVSAQDRSGFAHFDYTAGVGAYNDNGTLKDNAIVLYVTDSNKNSVSVTSKDGTTVTGIGNILNSSGRDNGSGATSKGGKPNTNADIIRKLAEDGTPLVVRFVGSVSAPAGVTEYDSVNYGGSVGDNGYMARIQDGLNITLEGIGEDAQVDGWGFHFMATSAHPELGKSFEVRNVSFVNVPEDCIGMEGVQVGTELAASVERCWVHNCSFYKPSIANPAESDKDGGDGACDFKRGQYFTNSYCYYEGYHKTNLVGASDSNVQYHITYHHNYWKDCESRGPLLRQANVHMYNNVFDGQTSYCMNPRANGYIFSEYNVFVDSKNPMQIKKGAIKSYNDTFTNCKGDQDGTIVTSKSTKVSSDNKYASYELDSSLCYIPSGDYVLHTSDVQNVTAKLAGTMKATGSVTTGGTEVETEEVTTAAPETEVETTKPAETETEKETDAPAVSGDTYVHNFTEDGKTSTFFNITGNLSTSKGTVNYAGLTLKQCLKMESSTNVSFTTDADAKLVLVFNSENSSNVKIDGVKYELVNGALEMELTAGTHTITKADTANLFYIAVTK